VFLLVVAGLALKFSLVENDGVHRTSEMLLKSIPK
jgi:hypothetical protein